MQGLFDLLVLKMVVGSRSGVQGIIMRRPPD